MTFLFDTSALVAHALRQEGVEQVQSAMDQEAAGLLASALSLFELAGVLQREGCGRQVPEFWRIYSAGLEIIPVTADLAQAAWGLRESTGQRLPLADAIIAATARSRGATLVHRDRHLAAIPDSVVPQIRLPAT